MSMSRYFHTHAITLQKKPVGENDRMFTLYTKDFGKLSALAVGSRKIKSRLASHLEPFGVVEFGFVEGITKKRVAHALCVERYPDIFYRLDDVHSASFALRLVDRCTKPGEPDEKIYYLLKSFFKHLSCVNLFYQNVRNAVLALRFLSYLGYTPEIRKCVVCGSKIADNVVFSESLGGIVCFRCQKDSKGVPVTPQELAVLSLMLEGDLTELSRSAFGENIVKTCNTLIAGFLQYHLEDIKNK